MEKRGVVSGAVTPGGSGAGADRGEARRLDDDVTRRLSKRAGDAVTAQARQADKEKK